MSLSYKKLEPTDLTILRELNLVFADAFGDQKTHLSNRPSDYYLTQLLSRPTFIALAALEGSRVVGGLIAYVLEKYEQERSEIYIYDLAVDEAFRRRGIARALIERLQSMAKDYGAWAIFVQADKVDTPAVRLYESMGVSEEPIHFDIPVK